MIGLGSAACDPLRPRNENPPGLSHTGLSTEGFNGLN
jgi:hypothetical protein